MSEQFFQLSGSQSLLSSQVTRGQAWTGGSRWAFPLPTGGPGPFHRRERDRPMGGACRPQSATDWMEDLEQVTWVSLSLLPSAIHQTAPLSCQPSAATMEVDTETPGRP